MRGTTDAVGEVTVGSRPQECRLSQVRLGPIFSCVPSPEEKAQMVAQTGTGVGGGGLKCTLWL